MLSGPLNDVGDFQLDSKFLPLLLLNLKTIQLGKLLACSSNCERWSAVVVLKATPLRGSD